MAQPTGTHSTYDLIGAREDLSEIIHMISPTKTPFLTAITAKKADGVKHEWLKDALDSVSSSNFVIEGDDATTDTITARTRVYNYCAISDKVSLVTGTAEEIRKAGVDSEMARQMTNKMKSLKRDFEAILLENNAHVVGTDTQARESAGLQAYLKTNINKASDATACTGDGTDAHTDGTARTLQESFLEDVLSQCWTSGGEPTLGICNAFQKKKIATFSGNSTAMTEREKGVVRNTVDIYIDPLGNEIKFVPCHQAPTDVVYCIDLEHVAVAYLRKFQQWDLAKTGDSIRKQILVEGCLEVGNEAAHGVISDLSAS